MTSAVLDKTPPSAVALSISSLLLGLLAGYFIGSGSSIGLFSSPSPSNAKDKRKEKKSWPNSYDVNVHVDSSDEELMAAQRRQAAIDADDEESEEEDSDAEGNELGDFSDSTEEVKLMLVVRTDLGMTKGKIAAQCGHATLAVYKTLAGQASSNASASGILRRWENNGQPKIAVQCKSEEELLLLQGQAMSLGLVARVIRDAGRTQIAAGSSTVLGLLGPKSLADQVTGSLKLL